jgi:uncharacterized protein
MPSQRLTTRQPGLLLRRPASRSLLSGALLLLLCAFCAAVLVVRAANPPVQTPDQLKPQGYVNDFANVLSPSARDQLTALCAEVDHKAQAQIAIVTIHSLGGRPIEDYSIDLATRWGIGPKQKDRGVMILVATGDHKYRFEVGYGLEGILPDGKVGSFGREAVPFFRQNNYDAALLLMTRRVAEVIAADRGVTLTAPPAPTPPPPQYGSRNEAPSTPTQLVITLILLVIIFRIVRAVMFAGTPGRYRRGGGGAWWIGPMMMGGFGRGGFGGGGWGGGSFGGGGGSGGFGGFGGGSFGGGGASGSW